MGVRNIFYLIFLINLLKFSLTKPIESKVPKDIILDFYESGLSKVSKVYCVKAKNISEDLLKDEKIKWADSPELQEFKKNITEFLHKYQSLQHYELYDDLVTLFDELTESYFEEEECKDFKVDTCHIKNLLINLGYDELNDDYEEKYYKFIVEEFIPKCGEFKSQLNAEELKKEQNFLEWYEELKTCNNYSCQYGTFSKYFDTPESTLVDYINKSILDLHIYYCDKAANISENILKDIALLQTNTPIVKEFRRNITEFLEKFSSNKDSVQLRYIAEFYSNITTIYSEMPEDKQNSDSNLIASILRKFGSEQLEEECEEKFSDFVTKKFKEKFEEFKSQLNEEELRQEKPLLDWYEELKLRKMSVVKVLETLDALK